MEQGPENGQHESEDVDLELWLNELAKRVPTPTRGRQGSVKAIALLEVAMQQAVDDPWSGETEVQTPNEQASTLSATGPAGVAVWSVELARNAAESFLHLAVRRPDFIPPMLVLIRKLEIDPRAAEFFSEKGNLRVAVVAYHGSRFRLVYVLDEPEKIVNVIWFDEFPNGDYAKVDPRRVTRIAHPEDSLFIGAAIAVICAALGMFISSAHDGRFIANPVFLLSLLVGGVGWIATGITGILEGFDGDRAARWMSNPRAE